MLSQRSVPIFVLCVRLCILRVANGQKFCLRHTLLHNGLVPGLWLAVIFGRVPLSWKVALPPLIKCGLPPAAAAFVAFSAAIMKANKQQILLLRTAHKSPFAVAHLDGCSSSLPTLAKKKKKSGAKYPCAPIKFYHVSHVCEKKKFIFLGPKSQTKRKSN